MLELDSLPRRLMAAAILLAITSRATAGEATIYRDRFGVPSVSAKSLPDAIYGLGYAMAQDNAERMALNYKQARGRLAEVSGRSQLLSDTFIHALGLEEMAERKSASLTGEQAVLMRAFCNGANRALAEQAGRIPAWIKPFTPVDTLALAQLVNAAFPLQEVARQLLPGVGSNQFAVAPSRSSNHHALLSADPHLPWSGPLLWYEFALYTPDFNFRGVTPAGLPFGSMGHTDYVAWSMTNNNPDLFDFFTIVRNPQNPRQYSYHGEWREFEDVSFELKYLENGELKTSRQSARRTAWGPVVPFRPTAVGFTMLGRWEMLDQALAMARARSAAAFRQAINRQGLSMWNIAYADTAGHIGYQFNAYVPRRDASFDWSKPVPGDTPKTKWGPAWSADDLPHAEDPASGLLVNCNSSPALTTMGDEIPEGRWPGYVTSYGRTTRYDRLAALLAADNNISVKEAMRYATDTEVPYALKAAAALRSAARELAPSDPSLKEPVSILAKWNGRADIDSRGCGLYLHWFRARPEAPALARKAFEGKPWSESEKRMTLDALRDAASEMRAQFKRLDVPWGEIHFSKRNGVTVPVSGLGYAFGYGGRGDYTATVTPNFGTYKDGRISCEGGSSFRMIVDLDPRGVRSWSILPYGDSQNPASPHYTDQMALHGRGEYKDTHFGVAASRKAAVTTTRLLWE